MRSLRSKTKRPDLPTTRKGIPLEHLKFRSLPAGEYKVSIEGEGYRKFVSMKKTIGVAGGQSFDVTLQRWNPDPQMTHEFYQAMQRMDGERLIVPTTDPDEVERLRAQGCIIIHELSDSVAAKCPRGVKIEGAIPDEVFHLLDADSNAQIGADQVHLQGYDGSGVTVALVDTGIDTDNVEFAGNIAGGMGFGYPTYEDDSGHGTTVASVIDAKGVDARVKGVAPRAKIWAAKVCDAGSNCFGSDILAAFDFISNNHIARIISISLGGGHSTEENCDAHPSLLTQKVSDVVSKGVTVIAAAGNDAQSGRGVGDPGCASGAIGVGPVDANDVRGFFSQYGPALDLVAPGLHIYTTNDSAGYGTASGTSYSTPHVAGVIALLLQAFPALTDTQIKNALYKTAKDLGPPGRDDEYAWGRVDAQAALNYLKAPLSIDASNVPDAESGVAYNFDIGLRGVGRPYTLTIGGLFVRLSQRLHPIGPEHQSTRSDHWQYRCCRAIPIHR